MQTTTAPLDFPALHGRPVTEAHARDCRDNGHAAHVVNSKATGICPRCGEVTDPSATTPAATDAPSLAATAALFRASEERALAKARSEFDAAAATNVAYAVKWNLEAVVRAEARAALWTVAAERGAGALTGKLAEFMNPNDLRSGDPFARAAAEAQREAAFAVLNLARPYVDAVELADRLS